MIKPLPPQTPDQTVTRGGRGEEQLMFVVEVGKVKLALPPRLSKVVQLFKEGQNNPPRMNGTCHVTDEDHVTSHHVVEDLGNTFSNHDIDMRNQICHLTNGQVENGTSSLTNGYHTPSPVSDISEDGFPRERRDYRGLVKVHKTKRKLPELPSDPKMSIFNNLDRLGVLEAELDVKKLEFKIRKQRQKVAAEFRSLTPEQRHELVRESPYLQKQIQRAMRSREVGRHHSTSGSGSSFLSDDDLQDPSFPPLNLSSSTFSSDTITCSTPRHAPPPPSSTNTIDLDSTVTDLDSTLGSTLASTPDTTRAMSGTPRDSPATSPLPLPETIDEELLSICSDVRYTTPSQHTPTSSLSTPVPSPSSSSESVPADDVIITDTAAPLTSDIQPVPDIRVVTPTEHFYSSITPPPSDGSSENENSPSEIHTNISNISSDKRTAPSTKQPSYSARKPPIYPPSDRATHLEEDLPPPPSPPPPVDEEGVISSHLAFHTPLPVPLFEDEDELPPYSEHDLTYVSPLPNQSERCTSEVDLTRGTQFSKTPPSGSKTSPSYSKTSPSDSKTPPSDSKTSPSDRKTSPSDRKTSRSDSKTSRSDSKTSDSTSDHSNTSYSTSALEISHTPTHPDSPHSRKILSDSEVNMISVYTPECKSRDPYKSRDPDKSRDTDKTCDKTRDMEPSDRGGKRRSELCTPTHPLSASDSQLHRKRALQQGESYERAQSVPYGIEKSTISTDIENILAKKFTNQKKNYSSMSISDKLEEIQSRLSPKSFINSCAQDLSSYTLSYEDDLGDIEVDQASVSLYDDVIATHDDVIATHNDVIATHNNVIATHNDVIATHKDVIATRDDVKTTHDATVAADIITSNGDVCDNVETDGAQVATHLRFDLEEYNNSKNTTPDKSKDVPKETKVDDKAEKEEEAEPRAVEEERVVEEVADALSGDMLNCIIDQYTDTFTAPPPPYVPTTEVEMRVSHSTEEIRTVAEQAVDYFITCVRCGKPVDLNRPPDTVPDYADPVSYSAFCGLLANQAHELFTQATNHFNLLGANGKPPPWIREQIRPPQPPWLLKHSRTTRPTLESIKPLVVEEVVATTTTTFYSIEGVLSKEVVQGDALWQDFNKDEVAMKFRLADILLVNLLQDTVNSFQQITERRSSGHHVFNSQVETPSCERTQRQRTLSL